MIIFVSVPQTLSVGLESSLTSELGNGVHLLSSWVPELLPYISVPSTKTFCVTGTLMLLRTVWLLVVLLRTVRNAEAPPQSITMMETEAPKLVMMNIEGRPCLSYSKLRLAFDRNISNLSSRCGATLCSASAFHPLGKSIFKKSLCVGFRKMSP